MHQITAHSTNQDQLNAFSQRGHAQLRDVLPRTQLDTVRDSFLGYIGQMHAGLNAFEKSLGASATRATFNLPQAPKPIQNFVRSPRLGEVAANILGVSRVRVLHFNGFFKPAGGIATPWHQDMNYIPLDCKDVVTFWLPLVPIVESMGTLVFASGSHQSGSSVLPGTESNFDLASNHPMEPGDVSIHHGWTAHRSDPNVSTKTREAVAISYYPDGTKVSYSPGGPPMMASILEDCLSGLKTGDLAQGPATPIVFEEKSPISLT